MVRALKFLMLAILGAGAGLGCSISGSFRFARKAGQGRNQNRIPPALKRAACAYPAHHAAPSSESFEWSRRCPHPALIAPTLNVTAFPDSAGEAAAHTDLQKLTVWCFVDDRPLLAPARDCPIEAQPASQGRQTALNPSKHSVRCGIDGPTAGHVAIDLPTAEVANSRRQLVVGAPRHARKAPACAPGSAIVEKAAGERPPGSEIDVGPVRHVALSAI